MNKTRNKTRKARLKSKGGSFINNRASVKHTQSSVKHAINYIFKKNVTPSNADYIKAYNKIKKNEIDLYSKTLRGVQTMLHEPYLTNEHITVLREMQTNPARLHQLQHYKNIQSQIHNQPIVNVLGVSEFLGSTFLPIFKPSEANITERTDGLYVENIDNINEYKVNTDSVGGSDIYKLYDKKYETETEADKYSLSYEINDKKIRSEIVDCVKNFKNFSLNALMTNWTKSNIPIYIVVVIGAEYAFHLSIIILCNNKLYSIGLGYHGVKPNSTHPRIESYAQIKSSSLYTPDYLIKPTKKNRIVDIGILTENHVAKIQQYLNCSYEINVEGERVNDTTIKLISTFLELDSTQCPLYCKYTSSSSSSYINCTSFVTSIFPNINCDALYGLVPIVNPKNCHTNPPINESTIRTFFEYYYNPRTSVNEFVTFLYGIHS